MTTKLNEKPEFELKNVTDLFYSDDNPYENIQIDSKFYDNNEFFSTFSANNQPILLNLNVQSLNSKFSDLRVFVLEAMKTKVNIAIIALQETWKIPNIDSISIPGFTFYHTERKKSNGGGVGFYIRSDIPAKKIKHLSPFEEKSFETLTLEIKLNGKKMLLTNIYRPPSSLAVNVGDFLDNLEGLLENLNQMKIKCCVFMDSNINILKLNNCDLAKNFLDCCLTNGFLQTIFKATRIQNKSFSLIDQIFVNFPDEKIKTGVIVNDISDHFLNFLTLPIASKSKKDEFFTRRVISSVNMEGFRLALADTNWDPPYNPTVLMKVTPLFGKPLKLTMNCFSL